MCCLAGYDKCFSGSFPRGWHNRIRRTHIGAPFFMYWYADSSEVVKEMVVTTKSRILKLVSLEPSFLFGLTTPLFIEAQGKSLILEEIDVVRQSGINFSAFVQIH